MRKLYAFLFTALFLVSGHIAMAQVANYAFTQSNGTFTAETGGTLLGNTSSDDQRFLDPAVPLGSTTATTGPGFPIGFTFNYNGIDFDRIGINNNGWICLGQSALTPSVNMTSTSYFTNPLASTATVTPGQFRNRIGGIARDLQGQTGSELRIVTVGSAPNRRCVIQWTGFRRFAGSGENINFQIVLNETTNIVNVNFGTNVINNTTATCQTGLSGTVATDFNLRTTTTSWAATTAGAASTATCSLTTTVVPASGLIFAWTPAPPCTGVPSPGLISGPAAPVCNPTNVNLTLGGYTVAPGISFQWRESNTPGGPYTAIAGATNATYSYSATVTKYFICTVTCSNSGLSSNTTEFAVNVNTLAHTAVSATPSTTCAPGSAAITGTATGGVLSGGLGTLASSGTINLAIPDNNATGVSSSITLPAVSIPNAASLRIRINVSHTWAGDMLFRLTSPCGTTFLFDRPGVPPLTFGNSDNLGTTNAGTNPPPGVYTFDIAAATVIPETAGASGFIAPGSYRPSDAAGSAHNWAGFTFPCTAGGTWTLTAIDNGGGDLGTLVDWSIIGPTSGNYAHALTGPGTIVQNPATGPNGATANFSVSNLPAGVHTFTLTSNDGAGCSVSSQVSVTVNPVPVVTLSPSAPVICAGTIQQISANVTPPITQTFASGTISLNIIDNATVTTPPIVIPAGVNINAAGNLRIQINARHSWVGDLIFRLNSPCGTTFLFDRPGVPASGFGNSANLGTSNAATPPPAVYIFDLAAATVIPETAPASGFIPAGSYRPSDAPGNPHNWAGLTFPCTATGNWTLSITDNVGGDVGQLVDWAILYDQSAPAVFSPATNLWTNAAATIPYVAGTPVTTVWTNTPTTATYTATATAAGCTSAPATVTVTVNQLPAITTQPVAPAAPVCAGFNVTYSIAATGTGISYQWQVSTDNGVTWNNVVDGLNTYSGATTNALTVLSITSAQNNYRYRCIVSGTCTPAVTSNSVTLVIATPPTITTAPANVTVCEGFPASFSVVAAGVPAPTIYQWQVSTNGGTTWTNLTTGGSYTPTYSIPATSPTLNGYMYRCIVTNNCGQNVTSASATLTVNALTTLSIAPLPSRICISDTLVPLNATPVGGSWSGIGVSGFNFVPPATAVGGNYTLTYTYTNAAGCVSRSTVNATVVDCPERIRLLRNNAVILFPNPNNGRFNIRINSVLYNYLGMSVYNTAGQLVHSKTFSGLVYGRVVPIDLTYLPSGNYMVKFFYDDGIRTSEKTIQVAIGR